MTNEMKGLIFYSKADLKSAFYILPVFVRDRAWLILMAEALETGEKMYFVEKCLPFGASISCALFQAFSDALQHVTEFLLKTEDRIMNYLDNFLFIAMLELECNHMMETFISLCKCINCPISEEKSECASSIMVFLGILLNGIIHCLCLPEDKRIKAVNKLKSMINKKKATIKEIQELTGILNFLSRAIIPGRAFTRRMYAKLRKTKGKGQILKQHHHVYLDKEFREDCNTWLYFLEEENHSKRLMCHPFVDLNVFATSIELNFYMDASGKIGFGCFFNGRWTCGCWSMKLLKLKPSIEFLELFVLCAGIFTWEDSTALGNTCVVIFCDNQAVVNMINNTTSGCKACMKLIRLLVLNCLKYNWRIAVKYVKSSENILVDSLSREKWNTFWDHAPSNTKPFPDKVPDHLFPVEKFFS